MLIQINKYTSDLCGILANKLRKNILPSKGREKYHGKIYQKHMKIHFPQGAVFRKIFSPHIEIRTC